MKKKLVIFAILAMFVTIRLSGCTNNPLDIERNKFVGSWKLAGYDVVTLTLYSNGTSIYAINETETTVKGTWEVNDENFTNTLYQLPRTFTYYFSDNDKKLSLTAIDGGEVTVFIKQ